MSFYHQMMRPDVCDATMQSLREKPPIDACGVTRYTLNKVCNTIKSGIDHPERLLPTWIA